VQPSSKILKKVLTSYEVSSKDELYSKIGSGQVNLDNLAKILKKNTKNKWIKYWQLQLGRKSHLQNELVTLQKIDTKKPFLLSENVDSENPPYVIARCCNPIPGDDVIGYISPDDVVIIHKATCAEAIRLMAQHGDRIVSAKWTTHKVLSFLARIEVKGMDRIGIINDLTRVISSELMVNIRKFHIESHDGIFEGFIDLYVHDISHLNNLIFNLMKLKGMDNVKRVDKFDD
ncbi:MAG TPA: GTP pyrophosphokinase, partial [Tenuifilaceae bacterium]|nr:GTP pyrophosphokinase [Tenuifilaceae bacterium]